MAVVPIFKCLIKSVPDDELKIETHRGTGKGGQHQNTTDSAVRIKHIPTGIKVNIEGRDQHQNRKIAMQVITSKVNDYKSERLQQKYDSSRKSQLDGDKVRTYNMVKGRVTDHKTGKKTSNIKAVLKGDLMKLL